MRWQTLLKLGLSTEQAAHFLGISQEALEAEMAAAEERRRAKFAPGRQMMTKLLERPEMDRREWKTAAR